MNNQITSFPIIDIDKQNSWLVQSNSNDEILQALKSDASFPHNQVQKDALNQLMNTRPGEVLSAILLGTRKDWQSLADDYCGDMTSNALAEVLDSLLRSSDLIEDRLPKCRYLLARKFDESKVSGCIFRLAAEDHLEAIKMMIEVDKKLIETSSFVVNNDTVSLLHFAILDEKFELAQYLFEAVPSLIDGRTSKGRTILHAAIFSSSPGLIKDVLSKRPDFAYEYDHTDDGFTTLQYAVLRGSKLAFTALLENVKDPRHLVFMRERNQGFTVLHVVASKKMSGQSQECRNNEFFLMHLMENYSSLLTQYANHGLTAMHVASAYGDVRTVQLLFKHVPYLVLKKDELLYTPLESAVNSNNMPAIDFLRQVLENDTWENSGQSLIEAMIKALSKNNTRIASELWAAACKSDGPDMLNCWAFVESVISAGETTMAGKLLEIAPGLLVTKGAGGRTTLHIAAAAGRLDMIKIIVGFKKGKEMMEAKSDGNLRPIDVALRRGHFDIVEYLLSNNKNLSKQFFSIAPLFKEKENNEARDKLAITIAENDYRDFFSKKNGANQFIKKLKAKDLSDEEVAQRLVAFVMWAEASKLGVGAQYDELAAMFNGVWVAPASRWVGIRKEAAALLQQAGLDKGVWHSPLAKNMASHLTVLELKSESSDNDSIAIVRSGTVTNRTDFNNESGKSLMEMISTVDSHEIFSPMQSQQDDKDLTRNTDFLRTIQNEEFFLESQSIEKLQLKFNLDAVPYFPNKRSASIGDAYSMLDRGDVPFKFEDYGAYLWG